MRLSTAEIVLRPDGIVHVQVLPGARQTKEDAAANLAQAIAATGGVSRPILVDIRRAARLEAEVRHYYRGELMAGAFSAIAMLVEASPVGRMMGNIYLQVSRPGFPFRLFEDEARALRWLEEHLS